MLFRSFPVYGFDTNRGYGTRAHWDALERYGPSPIHRRSFKGVREIALAYDARVQEPLPAAPVGEALQAP